MHLHRGVCSQRVLLRGAFDFREISVMSTRHQLHRCLIVVVVMSCTAASSYAQMVCCEHSGSICAGRSPRRSVQPWVAQHLSPVVRAGMTWIAILFRLDATIAQTNRMPINMIVMQTAQATRVTTAWAGSDRPVVLSAYPKLSRRLAAFRIQIPFRGVILTKTEFPTP